jgi:FMN reductase
MIDAHIVGFSANGHRPSRTRELVQTVTEQIAQRLDRHARIFDLYEIDETLRRARYRIDLEGEARDALVACEIAEALFIGVSVERARGYPGLLKHFFDMADPGCMRAKPVVLLMTDAVPAERRVAELQLKLMFRSLGARVIQTVTCGDKLAERLIERDPSFRDDLDRARRRLAGRLDRDVPVMPA